MRAFHLLIVLFIPFLLVACKPNTYLINQDFSTTNLSANMTHRIQDLDNDTWIDVEYTTDADTVEISIANNRFNISANATHWWIEDDGYTVLESNGSDTWIRGGSGSYLHIG